MFGEHADEDFELLHDMVKGMRYLTLALLVTLPLAARADAESPAARAARLAAADDTGSLRDAQLHGPQLSDSVSTGAAIERAPASAPAEAQSTGSLSGALEEVVGRQMERNAAVFDHCVTDAKHRDPSLHGDLAFDVTVAQRKASAIVTTPADAALKACISAGAQTMRVSLPNITFAWHVSLGKASAVATRDVAH